MTVDAAIGGDWLLAVLMGVALLILLRAQGDGRPGRRRASSADGGWSDAGGGPHGDSDGDGGDGDGSSGDGGE